MSIFEVSGDCQRLGLRAGALVLRGVQISASSELLRRRIDDGLLSLQDQYRDLSEVRAQPAVAEFREIHRRVGANPRKQPPSVQSLLQYALKQESLPRINNLVDIYNLLSVQTCFSMGAHDLDRLSLPVVLQTLRGGEEFTPLGSSTSRTLSPGDFAYVDAQRRVVCWRDVQQADFSKVVERTKNVLLIIEGNTAHTGEDFANVFDRSTEWITEWCGGSAEIAHFPNLS